MKKCTGVMPNELLEHGDGPECFEYIWHLWLELRGDDLLTFTEIKAWQDLTCQQLEIWHVELIRAIDRMFRRVDNERRNSQLINKN